MRNDLIAQDLFGNEAGEDEDIEVLDSYFVEKVEFRDFYSERNKFKIVQTRKGVGKSALLRRSYHRTNQLKNVISIYVKGADLVALQQIDSSSADALLHGWQQRICSRINHEIGRKINFAINDDSITLVESSELAGFRGRDLVGSLIDRFRMKLKNVEVSRLKDKTKNAITLLERYSKQKNPRVWIYIDDVDATFKNNEKEKTEKSTFFSACRNLANQVNGLCIRASVRTDVWAILRRHDEALDKCDQYLIDILWTALETREILSKKILSYFRRSYPENSYYESLRLDRDRERILGLVFPRSFPIGRRKKPTYRALHTFSDGRPRWAAQLCRMAGKEAYKRRGRIITMSDITRVLTKYGEKRLDDLYREHGHQCKNIGLIIQSFTGGERRYSTDELLARITKKILGHFGQLRIDGMPNIKGALGLAHFLYRIGFIQARQERSVDQISFTRYEEQPDLLTTRANLDESLVWEIHPSYRQALKIQKPSI